MGGAARDAGSGGTPHPYRHPGGPPPARDEGLSRTGFRCDLCGGPMLDRHCKLLCLRCGYQRDCSDP